MHQFWWQMICLSSRQCATFQLWLGEVNLGLTVLKSGPAFRSFFWFICHCDSSSRASSRSIGNREK
ncbi:MAG: hypothetical protein CME54_04955 [Halieaceae bacterium]|nr:hypothetical protein [Halieaceae bacterium]